jgi:hypothetical protein
MDRGGDEKMTDILEFHPLKMQKEAQNMDKKYDQKIKFLLVTSSGMPVNCVWLDEYLGMFAVEGQEEKGFVTMKDIPEGSIILNQRVE